ncbi:MAG TPA: hypothetical protein VGZ48_07345 [Candidatus Acidoferrales bacterium]|jgi:hypothetical protein|nr:hypothetical protein [Candidatus Acidoferrales bacterium]
MYETIQKHLLYHDVIEGDGKVHREETFAGAFLAFAVLIGGAILIYWLASFL